MTWTAEQVAEYNTMMGKFEIDLAVTWKTTTILSSFLSFMVLVSALIFYEKMVKGKIFMILILNVALMDFLGTTVMSIGYPTNATLCKLQGAVQFFAFRASWLWTIAMSIVTYNLVLNGTLPPLLSIRKLNIIIYSMNIALEILPLCLGDRYGFCNDGKSFGHLGTVGTDPRVVQFSSDFVWLILAIIISLVLPLYLIFGKLRSTKITNPENYYKVRRLLGQVLYFPVCLLLFWGPNSFYAMYYLWYEKAEMSKYPISVSASFAITQTFLITGNICYGYGIFTSCIFFYLSTEARSNWALWLSTTFPNLLGWCKPSKKHDIQDGMPGMDDDSNENYNDNDNEDFQIDDDPNRESISNENDVENDSRLSLPYRTHSTSSSTIDVAASNVKVMHNNVSNPMNEL
jgi:hypothetical protein